MEAARQPDADPEPSPPRAPEDWECCRSGCDPCIYDLYWESLSRYEEAVKAWRLRHPDAL